ncbi:MAG: hypothetical protein QOE29_1235, partial [Gaiellaceae bacterium]|nr:hypothetical protein [Gaiellaceae bacterium]
AVPLVCAERRVDEAKPVEELVKSLLVGGLVSEVDDNRHSHHELDTADAWLPVVAHGSDFLGAEER